MKLSHVYQVLDGIAPKALSDEYCAKFGAYDNSGILVDTGDDIKGVLCSLELTRAAIEKAKEVGANLIVTHHPVIYGKISDIRESDFQPLDKNLIECIKHGISVVSMHLNLDVVGGGIDESLMQAVRIASAVKGDQAQSVALIGNGETQCMEALENGAYGRVYAVQETTLLALANGLKKVLRSERVQTYGSENTPIKKAASFCGAGADEHAVQFAVEQGADVLISSDFKHHVLVLAMEKGLSVITLTHYASEQYGFEKYYQKIRTSIDLPCVYHTDKILL